MVETEDEELLDHAQPSPLDEIYDSSDPKKVGKALRDGKARQNITDDGFKELIASPLSRAWLWNFLTYANVFAQSFTADPLTTAFNEGRRSMGNMVMADIQRLCPEMYPLMIRESQEKAYG